MNADDMKRLLERSLHEGGMDSAPGPDEALLVGRVRGARRRRAAGSVMAGVASIALVAAVVWQVGGFTTDPNPPATPTQTTATDDPTTDPSGDPTTEPTDDATDSETETATDDPADEDETDSAVYDGTLPDFSDAVIPECGEVFALPERTSALVVEGGPTETLGPMGEWAATVSNSSGELIQGYVTAQDAVVVDGDGQVVATIDTDFMGAEGPSYVGVAPGESVPIPIDVWGGICGELVAGSYQAYAMVTFVAADGTLEQAQGGPWPLEIGSNDSRPDDTPPSGTAEMDLQCGATWDPPELTTGMSLNLVDPIRTPRSADDDVDGSAELQVTQVMQEQLWTAVVVLQDGVIVTMLPGGDVYTSTAVSPGTSVPLSVTSGLLDCDSDPISPTPLPPGDYQVVVVAAAITGSENVTVVAVTEPTELTLQ